MNAVLLGGGSRSNAKSMQPRVEVGFSRYDQVSSMLTAIAGILSVVSMVLFVTWLTTIVRMSPTQTPIEWNTVPSGGSAGAIAAEHELEEPGQDELAETPSSELSQTLQQIGFLAPSLAPYIEQFESNAYQDDSGVDQGDRRDSGPIEVVENPPWERWEIRYSLESQEEYGAQLDSFDIELGAVRRDSAEIIYLKSLGEDVPESREGTKIEEERIFFAYQKGKLREWDEDFFRELDVDPTKYVLVHFYPEETKEQLKELELEAVDGRDLSEVKRTVFGVKKEEGGFKYYVIDIDYE